MDVCFLLIKSHVQTHFQMLLLLLLLLLLLSSSSLLLLLLLLSIRYVRFGIVILVKISCSFRQLKAHGCLFVLRQIYSCDV